MTMEIQRRGFLLQVRVWRSTAASLPACAQDKPKLRFSAVFSEQDIRFEMMNMFADAIEDDFAFEGYYGGTLFKQGTELVALQRGNLEMGNIAPQDFAKQIPEWSILTAAYLFRDADHLKTFFASDLGAKMKKMTEDQLGVRVLGTHLFRHPPDRPEAGQEDHDARGHVRASSFACPAAMHGSSWASRSAPIRCRWPMPRSIPGCRRAPSTARTIRCPTSRT